MWRLVFMFSCFVVSGGSVDAQVEADFSMGGGIKIGTSTSTCDGTLEGALRYNTTTNNLELCDGSSWAAVSVGACGDAEPDALSFTDLVNQSTSTLVSSNIDQVTGLSCAVSVAISGEGSPQFRTCSDSGCSTVVIDWTSTGTIDNGEYIQLRLTSSNLDGTALTAFLSVSNISTQWNVSTTPVDCTGTPLPGAVCADGTIYAGQSGAATNMYVTRCDAGMTWSGSACTGTRSSLPWNNGNNSDYVNTPADSATDGVANTAALDGLDSDSSIAGTQPHQAAQYCADLSQDGHTDWYLPAANELATIYTSQVAIGGFSSYWYWSSMESSTTYVWPRSFGNGSTSTRIKEYTPTYVRCARRD